MICKVLLPFLFVEAVSSIYQPGDAGAPWTEEEIDIVRDKVFFQAFIFLLFVTTDLYKARASEKSCAL